MARSRKLSGTDLAAQLNELPAFSVHPSAPGLKAESMASERSNTEGRPPPLQVVEQDALRPAPPGTSQSRKPQGGRPSKAGADGIPLNVRLSQRDHLALARLAGNLLVPGRPMPTVQDVVRGLIRGALQEPDAALRLVRQAEVS